MPEKNTIKNADQYINEVLSNISKENNINVYKPFFSVKGNETNLKIFANVGNKEVFLKKFRIKADFNFNDFNKKTYVANMPLKEKAQMGIVHILSKNKIYITNMSNMNNEGISGIYYVSDKLPFNTIKEIFNKNGLVISLNKHKMELNFGQVISNNKMTIIPIGILSILIAIIYIYYLSSRFKKIAIQKIYGYSNMDIFKIYFKKLLCMNLIGLAVAFAIQIVIIIASFKSIGLSSYVFYWIKIMGICFLIDIILNSSLILFTRHFKIRDMIKNKKPTQIIYVYSLFFKVLISFILVGLILNSVMLVFQYKDNMNALGVWNQTRDYVHVEYNQPIDILTEKGEEFVKKNQYLYSLLNSNGILCVPPTIYQVQQKNTENFKGFGTYSLFYGNSILVNSNYLRKNPIYYENGERVNFKDDYGDYLIVLVPEKYKKDQKDVEAAVERWYEFKKYSYINLLRQANHEKLVEGKAPVKIYYIKNNQKTFLYNVYQTNQKMNYSYNSVIAIINSQNNAGLEYLSYITTGEFMPSISDGYNNLNNSIKKAGLENYILNKPTIYSEIANTIYELKTYLVLEIFSLIILIGTEVLVNVFIIISFKESNKMKDSIKRMYGYSFKDINFKFNMINIGIWILICLMLLIIEQSAEILLVALIFMIIDIIFSNIFLLIFARNTNKNILTKE
ncbi:MAG: DUF1430 domain-containing protein [Clostridium sp.]